MIMTAAAVGSTDRNHNRNGGYYVGQDYCRAERAGSRLSHRAHCRCGSPARMVELLCCELKFQAGAILPAVTQSNVGKSDE